MATDIFVGYSSTDFHFSEAVMTALTGKGLRVWHEDQPSEKTTQLLEKCQIFLLVLSKGALLAPVLRNLALEYATLHNFHPENQLVVIQLEPLASRDLWLFIRHNPQIVRADETEAAFITRIGGEIVALDDVVPATDVSVLAVTNPRVASLNGSPSGKRKGKNQWRPFLAIISAVLALVIIATIAGRQLFGSSPHSTVAGTASVIANGGSTTTGLSARTPTTSPPPRAITTTIAMASATARATPRGTPTQSAPTQGAPTQATPTTLPNSPPQPTTAPAPAQTVIDFSQGFANANTLQLNGGATLSGTALQLTDNNTWEARSAFYTTPVKVNAFTCHFTFQDSKSNTDADGITFAIQNNNPNALGDVGGELGYKGIGNSIAVKFDLYSTNYGAPNDQISSTGLYLNGASPDQPETLLPQSMSFNSGDVFDVVITYASGTLAMTITDTSTNARFSQSYTVNVPATVGGNAAYVGFTGATGASSATQAILTWSYKVS